MKTRDSEIRKTSLKLIAVGVGAVIVWWLSSYQTWAFHGDGKIRDSGIFTYPRYHLEFNQIPFSKAGEHRFSFNGVPPEKMWLQLYVVGKKWGDAPDLTRLNTEMDVVLRDDQGNVLCTVPGVPIAGAARGGWILTVTPDSAAFYNLACVDLPMSRRRSYTLQVGIKNVDARSPSVFLAPTLLGGGIELP